MKPIVIAVALCVAAAPLRAQEGQRCRSCDTAAMRTDYRRTIADELERVRNEIERIRSRRRAQADQDGEVARALREVEEHLRASESHFRMMMSEDSEMAHMGSRSRELAPRPRMERPRGGQSAQGYLGVSLSGLVRTKQTREGSARVYRDYPVLVSVEPGSPAAEAGLMAGDVLLAYNGADVRARGIVLGDLRPGVQLPVRVRRGSAVKDVVVTVEPRPQSFVRVEPDVTVEVGEGEGPTTRWRVPRPPSGPRAPAAPEAAPPPDVDRSPMFIIGPLEGMFGTSPIAGAEITRMTAELRDVFNVDRGVLVLNVAAGTQAERSGLRGGDVITAVNGRAISSPIEVQRAMQRAQRKAVQLEIVRKQKKEQVQRTLTLEW